LSLPGRVIAPQASASILAAVGYGRGASWAACQYRLFRVGPARSLTPKHVLKPPDIHPEVWGDAHHSSIFGGQYRARSLALSFLADDTVADAEADRLVFPHQPQHRSYNGCTLQVHHVEAVDLNVWPIREHG